MKSIYVATIEDFHKVININLLGVTLCFQYAARQMIKQGRGGRIIGASSGAGKQGLILVTGFLSRGDLRAPYRSASVAAEGASFSL